MSSIRMFAALAALVTMATAAATITAWAQTGDSSKPAFCVTNSVSVPLACPSTVKPELVSNDGFMAIHTDNQKSGSPVAEYWEELRALGEAAVLTATHP